MLNYYDELKNSILEELEEEEYKEIIKQAEDKDNAYYELYDRFFIDDAITGNASGSYYCNAYEARKHCYNFSSDVEEALIEFCYDAELQNFKTFISLVKEGYLNIENMTLNEDILSEVDDDERCYVFYALEEIEALSFKALDVITRCYMLGEALDNVLDRIF